MDEIQAKTSSNDVDTRIKVMLLLLLLMMLVVVMMVKNDWDANQDCEDTR